MIIVVKRKDPLTLADQECIVIRCDLTSAPDEETPPVPIEHYVASLDRDDFGNSRGYEYYYGEAVAKATDVARALGWVTHYAAGYNPSGHQPKIMRKKAYTDLSGNYRPPFVSQDFATLGCYNFTAAAQWLSPRGQELLNHFPSAPGDVSLTWEQVSAKPRAQEARLAGFDSWEALLAHRRANKKSGDDEEEVVRGLPVLSAQQHTGVIGNTRTLEIPHRKVGPTNISYGK